MSETFYDISKREFLRGYACAVSNVIQMDGLVTSQTRELFRGGFGYKSIDELRKIGIDYNDLEVFEKYWNELFGT